MHSLWFGTTPRGRRLLAVGAGVLVAGSLAACGSSSSATSGKSHPSRSSGGSSSPSTKFGTATIAGLGTVVVDGNGKTVYMFTADGHTNAPCSDSSGCTKVWPDLPLPDDVKTATAGAGLNPSLLGTKKLSDGETYPTYHGWLMYEYAADSGPGQATGQGIKSFGGTWYVLSPAGTPITSSP